LAILNKELKELYLSDNQLSSLPESFGNLKILINLELYGNQLNSLPESFGNLQNLPELRLSNNQLSSLPESFGNLQNLSSLYLENNQLSSLPESFGDLHNLSYLDLSNNQLSSLPESFGNLKYLSDLRLSNNKLEKLNEKLTLISNLEHLDISINQLDSLPQNFENLSNIKYLNISINHIKTIPKNIGNLIKMIYMNASKNKIDELPESIGQCSSLIELNLSYNRLKSIPSSIGDLKIIKDLNVSNNEIINLPESLKYLSNLPKIDLSYNQIELFPYFLSQIKSLQVLNLSNNKISEINSDIQDFTNLLELNMSGNKFSSNDGSEKEFISDNIEMLKNLQSLDLSSCNLYYYKIPETLFNLHNLRYLNLSDNDLYKIPEHIENLTNLITLSLANNEISGNIDKSLCTLFNLSSLDLSENRDWGFRMSMQGDIPLEFSKLKNLTSLDLSGSKLYTTSPALEQFIKKIDPNWFNSIPDKIERNDLCINYITTSSDHLGYSLHATIPILIVMTQPVSLIGGNLIVNLETGDIDQEIHIPPFTLSYTATANYTVQEGDFSDDLNVNSIRLSAGASLTNENGETVDLTLIPGINLAAMKNIYVDGTKPKIKITEPDDKELCVEKLHKIIGTASDISKDFSVTLSIINQQDGTKWQCSDNFTKNITETFEFSPTLTWQEDTPYTIQIDAKDFAGNTHTISRSVTFGKKPSTITTHLSQNNIIFGQTIMITGNISPPENVKGEAVLLELVSPSGKTSKKPNAKEDGSFEYALECGDIDEAGLWQVIASWKGTSCLNPANSDPQTLTVKKASCIVGLDATEISVKLGKQVSITGKVKPENSCPAHLANIPFNLLVTGPEGMNEIELTTDNSGDIEIKNFTGFDTLGEWQIAASVKNNSYTSSFSNIIQINVVETAGYAIIVQGRIADDEEGLKSHNQTTNDVYHLLKQRGLSDDDILYFNYDSNQGSYKITEIIINQLNNAGIPKDITKHLKSIKNIEFITEESFIDRLKSLDEQMLQFQSLILSHSILPIEIDGLPTKNSIRKAITEDIPEIMKNQPANLYIVMVDHGEENTFYIEPDTISDDELNNWLTELENTPGWNQEIIVMLGFCFSGSFIDELSKPNRIIISSAGPEEFSYKGPLDKEDNIREGEFFISEFFKSVARGKDIKTSFSEAVIQTEIYTAKGEGSVNAPPYFDNSAQHPLLDDNGDKKGSNNVKDTSTDGHLAEQIIIGVSSLTMNDPGDVIIKNVSDAIFLDTDETTTDEIWAEVSKYDRVLTLWLEIKPPDFVPNEVGTGQVVMDLKKVVTINNNNNTNVYHWDSSDFDNKFDKPGTYHIYYFAKDLYSKNISPMKETIVYKASAVNDPPEPFDLISPANDLTITSLGVLSSFSADPTANAYTMLSWEKTTDPDKNDRITYTLLLKKDNDHFDDTENIIKYPNLTKNFHEINLSGDWDGATVYWKVQAIDNYGKIRNSKINRFYVNNANNPSNGTLWGYVFDENTKEAIPVMATISVSAGGKLVKQITSSKEDGLYFEAFKPFSNYKIEVQKEGYVTEVRTFVNVPADEKCQQNFYLKRDNSSSLLISSIPPQTINEGETFAPISLDTYISVMNVDKDQINWTVSGHKNLIITIDNNRKAIILPNDENWYGAEEITFYAEAPDHNKVSTSVAFTVSPVNDPPKILDIPDQTIFDSSKFQTIELDQYIQDIDNAYTEITWSAKGQEKLSVSIANRLATISVFDNAWIGYEDITFTAKDPSGDSDEHRVRFAILGKNEPVISLNHPKVVQINQNEPFIDPGYVAMDDIDGDITESVIVDSDVDTQTPGIYHVTYHATDSTGNVSEALDRIVIVNKNQFPTQKISGHIIDENNVPVGGVDIVITGQGHTYETTSHYHGSFELLMPITFDGSIWQMRLKREGFYTKTMEFSDPPSFETITLFGKDSNTSSVIKGQCVSYHGDGSIPVLPQVTIRARATDDNTVIASTISDSDGQYTLAVDVQDRNYTLEATKYGYEPQVFDTSAASNIVLIPLTKMIIEQPENMEDHDLARNINKVTLNISADPPFSNKTNELTVRLSNESATPQAIGKKYIENDHTYTLEYPHYSDFTINLRADTTEDQDATNGYFAEQTVSFQSIETSAQVVVTKGETDYQVTQPFYVEQSGLSSFMMIDRGGLSGLNPPKQLDYTIRDYTFPLNEEISNHVVEFVLKDAFGQEIEIIDNAICLGIGFEPPVSRENLENQTYELIHSETVADLLKGQGQVESSFSIFEEHVTFCTRHLNAYGFRKKGEQEQQEKQSDSGDDSGGCFLKTILNWDDN
jgi:Leucine-rich repeat (LRR) protein